MLYIAGSIPHTSPSFFSPFLPLTSASVFSLLSLSPFLYLSPLLSAPFLAVGVEMDTGAKGSVTAVLRAGMAFPKIQHHVVLCVIWSFFSSHVDIHVCFVLFVLFFHWRFLQRFTTLDTPARQRWS